jgi:formylglycine-generating enzyme required for sulfatase activity
MRSSKHLKYLSGLGANVSYKAGDELLETPLKLKFSYVPAGSFLMGTSSNYAQMAFHDEKPQHRVDLTHPIAVMRTPVTEALWLAVMGPQRESRKGADFPATNMTYAEAQEFCGNLSLASGFSTDKGYRLLTEAEWEYACRAGSNEYQPSNLDAVAWHFGNSNHSLHPVAQKKANAWGLYDMLGNVSEWTEDWYKDYYPSDMRVDPQGPSYGSERVIRGGNFLSAAPLVRPGKRDSSAPSNWNFVTGFRICRTLY